MINYLNPSIIQVPIGPIYVTPVACLPAAIDPGLIAIQPGTVVMR